MATSTSARFAGMSAVMLALAGAVAPVLAQEVELYAQPRFGGTRLRLTADAPEVAAYGIGSRIGSVVVRSGQWEFCTAVQYGGACITVGPGRYGEMPPALRGQVASVRRADAAMPPPLHAGGHPMPPPPGGLPPPPPSGQMPSGGVIPGPDAMQGWVRTVRGNEPVILFEHSNFDGRQVGIAGAVARLGDLGFNDQASSIFVHRGRWQLCEHSEFRGECLVLGPGRHDLAMRFNDRASSIRPLFGREDRPLGRVGAVVLFENGDFSGQSMVLQEPVMNLRSVGMNDRTSAIEVHGGTWEFCTDKEFSGHCMLLGPGRYILDARFNDRISSLRPR